MEEIRIIVGSSDGLAGVCGSLENRLFPVRRMGNSIFKTYSGGMQVFIP